jgi:hypothetical protein
MQRPLVACAIVSLLGWLAWLWLLPQASEPHFEPGKAEVAGRDASASPGLSHDEAFHHGEGLQAASAAPLARSQVPVQSLPGASEAGAQPVRVLVIDGGTRLPVVGAVVSCLAAAALEAATDALEAAGQPVPQDAEPLIGQHGGSEITAADGSATLHLAEHTMLVARHGDRYGSATFYAAEEVPPGGLLVVLERDRSVSVKVVDAAGEPVVGLPIALWVCGPDGAPQEFYSHQGATSTAPDGIAMIHHVQDLLEDDAAPSGDAVRLMPVVGLPGCPLDGPHFSLESPPDAPLLLVAPPLGSIHLHDPHGILKPGCKVWLKAVEGPQTPFQPDASYRDGWWIFPAVGVGSKFQLSESVTHSSMQCGGPKVAGEVVRIAWELSANAVRIMGRLVDGHGNGIANGSMAIHLHGWRTVRSRTDREGGFAAYLGTADGLRYVNTLHFREDSVAGQQATASNLLLTAGLHDLGELRLQPVPLVASGVLQGGSSMDLLQQLRLEYPSALPGGELQWLDCMQVVCPIVSVSPGGEFQILGTCPYPELRLSLRFHHLQDGPVVFAPPATGLNLVLVAPRKIMASALLPRHLPDDCIGMLSPVAGTPIVPGDSSGRNPYRAHSQRSGERVVFEWYVQPGRYDLSLHALGFPQPLVAIPGVATETAKDDGRLANIDLMSAVAGLQVEIIDEEGRQVEARMHAADCDRLGFAGTAYVEGNAMCLVPAGSQNLFFHDHDFQPVIVRGAQGKVRVVMERHAKTEFRFAAAASLPPQFACRLSVATPPGFRFDWSDPQSWYRVDATMNTFDGGLAALRFGNGPVTLELELVSTASGKTVLLSDIQPNPVRHSKTPITLTVPAQVLEAALAQLR